MSWYLNLLELDHLGQGCQAQSSGQVSHPQKNVLFQIIKIFIKILPCKCFIEYQESSYFLIDTECFIKFNGSPTSDGKYRCFHFAPDPVLTPCTIIEGNNKRYNKRGETGGRRKRAAEQRVKYVVWLPLIWLLSILPSCILPMMETYKTITTGITKADRSTSYWHRDRGTQWEPKSQNKETGKWHLIEIF